MTVYVVDTNVTLVANGKSEQASASCVLSCVRKIREIMENGKICIDDRWRIINEYSNKLRQEGQPGIGDAFLRWVLTNHSNIERCDKVHITPIDRGDPHQFQEFPTDRRLKKFDPSDRKFVAIACAHPKRPPILQAVDRKWWDFKDVFQENQIVVEFLCVQDCKG